MVDSLSCLSALSKVRFSSPAVSSHNLSPPASSSISGTLSITNSETSSPFAPWPSYTARSAIDWSSASGYVMRPRSWLILAFGLPYAPGFIPWLLYVPTTSGANGLVPPPSCAGSFISGLW